MTTSDLDTKSFQERSRISTVPRHDGSEQYLRNRQSVCLACGSGIRPDLERCPCKGGGR